MHTFLTEVRQTLIPTRSGRDGPLPPLLVAMTLVTGLVDAFSYLVLGHVFVANMTGNVVFLGFALAGAPGFSIGASVVALASFCLGALVGGQAGKEIWDPPGPPAQHGNCGRGSAARRLGRPGVAQRKPRDAGIPLLAHLRPGHRHGGAERHRPPGRRPGSHHHGPHPDHHRHRR